MSATQRAKAKIDKLKAKEAQAERDEEEGEEFDSPDGHTTDILVSGICAMLEEASEGDANWQINTALEVLWVCLRDGRGAPNNKRLDVLNVIKSLAGRGHLAFEPLL